MLRRHAWLVAGVAFAALVGLLAWLGLTYEPRAPDLPWLVWKLDDPPGTNPGRRDDARIATSPHGDAVAATWFVYGRPRSADACRYEILSVVDSTPFVRRLRELVRAPLPRGNDVLAQRTECAVPRVLPSGTWRAFVWAPPRLEDPLAPLPDAALAGTWTLTEGALPPRMLELRADGTVAGDEYATWAARDGALLVRAKGSLVPTPPAFAGRTRSCSPRTAARARAASRMAHPSRSRAR